MSHPKNYITGVRAMLAASTEAKRAVFRAQDELGRVDSRTMAVDHMNQELRRARGILEGLDRNARRALDDVGVGVVDDETVAVFDVSTPFAALSARTFELAQTVKRLAYPAMAYVLLAWDRDRDPHLVAVASSEAEPQLAAKLDAVRFGPEVEADTEFAYYPEPWPEHDAPCVSVRRICVELRRRGRTDDAVQLERVVDGYRPDVLVDFPDDGDDDDDDDDDVEVVEVGGRCKLDPDLHAAAPNDDRCPTCCPRGCVRVCRGEL